MVVILPDDDPKSLVFLGQFLEFTPLPSLDSCMRVHRKLIKFLVPGAVKSDRGARYMDSIRNGIMLKHALVLWAMLAERMGGTIKYTF
jgi:hypothetical protein